MSSQESVRQFLIGTGVYYLNFGYGIIIDIDEDIVRIAFDSDIRTFMRDVFAKSFKIDEPNEAKRLQVRLALEHNRLLPERFVPFLASIHRQFSIQDDGNAAFEEDGLRLRLLALQKWNEGKEPVINIGTLTASEDEDGLLFEYAFLFLMDEDRVFDSYEDEGYLLEYQGQLLCGLDEVAALYDPEADIYCCCMEEYNHYFSEDHLPDDGMYLGLRVAKRVHNADELETIIRFIEIFMEKCEFFIAQFATQPQTAADDEEEENEVYEEEENDYSIDDASQSDVELTLRDFVVISNRHECISKNHGMQKVRAILSFVYKNGEVEEHWLPAFHCRDCREYYLHEYDYLRAKGDTGLPLCRVVHEKQYKQRNQGRQSDYSNLAERSILHLYGYNVRKAENLSEAQRRVILDRIIANKVLNLFKVKSHIVWLIRCRERNHLMADAVSRWKEDLEYLKNEYQDDGTKIRVSTLRIKR